MITASFQNVPLEVANEVIGYLQAIAILKRQMQQPHLMPECKTALENTLSVYQLAINKRINGGAVRG